MAEWPCSSACCKAVWPLLSSSLVLVWARSSISTTTACPRRVLQENTQDGEVAAVRSMHERGETDFVLQVDGRASLQQFPHHLQVAVGCGGVQQGGGCRGPAVSSWNRAERVDRPSLAQPLDHRLQLASPGRHVRWGGSRGGGRLRQRCVLPDELRGGHVALAFGPLAGGAAAVIEQLGVGLGSQQGLHTRLIPFARGYHQSGAAVFVAAVDVCLGSQQGLHARLLPSGSSRHQGSRTRVGIQVGVGRVLQEEIQDVELAEVRSIHERCGAGVAWQVDARASLQQLPHHLQLAVGCGGVQQGAERIYQPSLAQPPDHRLQLTAPGRSVDLEGERGRRGHRGRRCVLPEELRGGRVSLALSMLQGGHAGFVEQLVVGLGSQQGLHACLVPSASGPHQSGLACVPLQVGVGRVLQENTQDGEVAAVRSMHERGATEAGRHVDARASLQQLPHHLQVAVGCGGVQQGCGCLTSGLTAGVWNCTERVYQPSLLKPLGHLLQLASPGRVVDLEGQRGGRARRGLDGDWWGGRRGGGRLRRRCEMPEQLRGGWLLAPDQHLKELHGGGGWLVHELGPLQGGAAFVVDLLSAGPG
eukprot:scaffold84248_cov61-Phaeocystis_antarctica.AAC.2